MTVIMAAANNPVTNVARQLYEQNGRTAITFESEGELEQLIAENPSLQNATALFPVPLIPRNRYTCTAVRLESLGHDASIPDWAKRFDGQLALLDMSLEQINECLPGLETAVRAGLKLPPPPPVRTEEQLRERANKREQRRQGQNARKGRAGMGHFCRVP